MKLRFQEQRTTIKGFTTALFHEEIVEQDPDKDACSAVRVQNRDVETANTE